MIIGNLNLYASVAKLMDFMGFLNIMNLRRLERMMKMYSYNLFKKNDFSGRATFDKNKIRYTGWILIDNEYKTFKKDSFTFNKNILNKESKIYFKREKKSKELYKNEYWFNKHLSAGICLNYCKG